MINLKMLKIINQKLNGLREGLDISQKEEKIKEVLTGSDSYKLKKFLIKLTHLVK